MEVNASKKSNKGILIVLIVGALILFCCACLCLAAGVGYFLLTPTRSDSFGEIYPDYPPPSTSIPEPMKLVRPEADPSSGETLRLLEDTVVPLNDPRELACRLKAICNVPEVMADSAQTRVVGDKQKFWVHNLDTNKNNEVEATLLYVTPHAYFWAQDGVNVKEKDMKALMDAFENKIYPTDREFFGSEWTPGIDGDEHIYILYARGLGYSVAGYFSSADSRHPLIQEYSNAHEMFLFNADNTPPGDAYAYAVLAHEFQHMIHWNNDLNETSWLNEGSSELAVLLNGYDTGGFDWLYVSNPDLQLNDWPNDHNATTPHYGAGFLFMTYFLDRFGEKATQALVKDPANGLESVDDVLKQINAADPLTGKPIATDDFFMDWALTNFLQNASIADGRYAYHNYPSAPRARETETISACPQDEFLRTVHQYGVDYIQINCAGDYTLDFTGSTVTGLLPVDPYSGKYAFWSNKGDESDMTLTREFDFSNVAAPIELSFQTWFDIEEDWDYVYLEVSEDGKEWQILPTPSGRGTNPSGNAYGWGYTGVSDGWINEQIDLSAYAGKKIFIRFEYVTDAAVNGEGFLLDDISVNADGYSSDFEADDGGWQADGFARVQNSLPQTFRLALVQDDTITFIPVAEDQTAQISLSLKSGKSAYLVVAGTTRFTRELATYQIEIR
ncbi:MAG: immune inhibitor A [Anaerolineales bacterium]|nr:immune inhibitor A [Anaerolineales bacterium]